MNALPPQPSVVVCSPASVSSDRSLRRGISPWVCTFGRQSLPEPVYRDSPCQHTGIACLCLGVLRLWHPIPPPVESHRGDLLRLRVSTAGRHGLRRADAACCRFFPRSVGLRPTSCLASGALIIQPSMLCHFQAMPSISSNSAKPASHSDKKKPSFNHRRKYLWIELALPKRSFGSAFQWQPVRSTNTIPSKTLRTSMGLRPPPDRRWYCLLGSRLAVSGMSASTRSQKASETSHDCTFPMAIPSVKKIAHGEKYVSLQG